MKVLCLFEGWWPKSHPEIGDICQVTQVFYDENSPDGISGYSFQEFPLPHPYRFGAWRKGPGGRLCRNFSEIEDSKLHEDDLISQPILNDSKSS